SAHAWWGRGVAVAEVWSGLQRGAGLPDAVVRLRLLHHPLRPPAPSFPEPGRAWTTGLLRSWPGLREAARHLGVQRPLGAVAPGTRAFQPHLPEDTARRDARLERGRALLVPRSVPGVQWGAVELLSGLTGTRCVQSTAAESRARYLTRMS